MAEILEIADARHMFGQEIDRHRPLQRQIVQIIVEQQRNIAPSARRDQAFMPGPRSMHHHPAIGAHAIENAIVDEVPIVIEHRRIGRLARRDLADIACGDHVEHAIGMRADQMHFLQPRHVHQPGAGADHGVIVLHVMGIGPCGAHAVPVFKVGTERAVTAGKRGKTPGIGHGQPLVQMRAGSGKGFLLREKTYQSGRGLSRR